MESENTNQIRSPLAKIAGFYLEQLERAAPVMKNAADDWQRYCHWCYHTASDVQRNLAGSNESAKTLIDQYQQTVQYVAESALAAQTNWAKTSIDGAVDLARRLVDRIEQQ